mmetsp:Transcript_3/g.12  ORF Transcript_3/g.12 Transcript_3/m.12 type:complete len:474 (+) Transcript_3:83-1504(+)
METDEKNSKEKEYVPEKKNCPKIDTKVDLALKSRIRRRQQITNKDLDDGFIKCVGETGKRVLVQALSFSSERLETEDSFRSAVGDSYSARLLDLQQQGGNDTCADCSEESGTWVSTTHGVFLCPLCVGAHRSLGANLSFTQSTTLDRDYWTPEHINLFEAKNAGGNLSRNKILEYRVPESFAKPAPGISGELRRRYIRAKYIDRAFTPENNVGLAPLSPVAHRKKLLPMESIDIGRLEFRGMVSVSVLRAENLKQKLNHLPRKGLITHLLVASPYIALQLGRRCVHTAYRKHTLNPVWNETPQNNPKLGIPWNGKDALIISAWSYDPLTKDELLGKAVLDFQSLLKSRKSAVTKWVKLFRPTTLACTCDAEKCTTEAKENPLVPDKSECGHIDEYSTAAETDEVTQSWPKAIYESYDSRLKGTFKGVQQKVKKQFSNVKRKLLKSTKECSVCHNVSMVESGKVLLQLSYVDLS